VFLRGGGGVQFKFVDVWKVWRGTVGCWWLLARWSDACVVLQVGAVSMVYILAGDLSDCSIVDVL
jgi:hypothetical protein